MPAADVVCGVDCGLGGALALWDPERRQLVGVTDMPVLVVRKDRRAVDAHALAAWFRDHRPGHVVIEAA
jgi:hypothetical protein